MSTNTEHNYKGLKEYKNNDGELSGDLSGAGDEEGALNLKATELRLGLPGSASPDRRDAANGKVGLTLGLMPGGAGAAKAFGAGAKRGFADAIDGSGKWGFGAGGNGSEVESGKGVAFMSSRGEGGGGGAGQPAVQGNGVKDVVAKAGVQDRKAGGNDRGMAPAAKAQVVGWPPIRSYRKNTMAINPSKNKEDADGQQGSGCLYIKVSMDGAPYLRKVDLKTYKNYKELSKELEKMFSGFTSGQCGSHAIRSKDGLSESRLMDFLSGSEYVLTYEDKDGDWMLVGDVPWEMFTDSCRKLRIMKGSDAIGLAPRAMEKCKNWN